MEKLISVDFSAQFGFLKRPDINESIYLTYNCLHKPALLGILGAIIGLDGIYQAYVQSKEQFPEYYEKLNRLQLSVRPLRSNNGQFQKTVVYYTNTVGYANIIGYPTQYGGTLQIREQTLINPSFRVYLKLEKGDSIEGELLDSLQKVESVYIPYLGKNDFQLWWTHFQEYQYEQFQFEREYRVDSLFLKSENVNLGEARRDKEGFLIDLSRQQENFFMYFENLPYEYDEYTKNYKIKPFVFTNCKFPKKFRDIENLFQMNNENNKPKVIQLY